MWFLFRALQQMKFRVYTHGSGESRAFRQESTIFVVKWRHWPELVSNVWVSEKERFVCSCKWWIVFFLSTRDARTWMRRGRQRRLGPAGWEKSAAGGTSTYTEPVCCMRQSGESKRIWKCLKKYFHLIHYMVVASRTTGGWEISWFSPKEWNTIDSLACLFLIAEIKKSHSTITKRIVNAAWF